MRNLLRSTQWIAAVALAALFGAAACGPDVVVQQPLDPCQPASYNVIACQQAIAASGYYWEGTFHHIVYVHPFDYYAGGYRTYIVHGGVVSRPSAAMYSRTYVAPTRTGGFGSGGSGISGSSGTVRGGFGGTGAVRSGGFGGGSFGG